MSAADRVLLVAYVVVVSAVAAGIAGAALGWNAPSEVVEFMLSDGQRRVLLVAGALAFLVAGARLLLLAAGRPRSRRALVKSSEMGDVTVTLSAVENLVRRVGRGIGGIRDVDARVLIKGERLAVDAALWVSPDASIPDVAEKLQRQIDRLVRDIVGVEVGTVRVWVRDIGDRRRGRRLDA